MLLTALPYGLLFISLYFEVFLLVVFLERRFESIPQPTLALSPAALPSVAIVVPCFNEGKTLAGTILSLQKLQYPKELLEILVVDDGSTDDTLAIARAFESDPRVHVYTKANGGKHTAMNFALEHTHADLIGCLDADSIVAPDALMAVMPVFAHPEIAAVTPGIHVKNPENWLQKMQHVEYQLSLFNRFMLAALGSVFITPGPFSIFRSSVVRELGGWREGHSTEDMEMALRIQEAGHLIANAPTAIVHTATPRTVKHLFRQRVRWTYGWLRNAIDYRHMLGNRRYGNLGLIILPSALVSIATAIYFAARIALDWIRSGYHEYLYIKLAGFHPGFHFDPFFLNTTAMMFLVFVSIGLILVLISAGMHIGSGTRKPPAFTPVFLFLYCFLVPAWLATAVVRAALNTGVKWR